MQKFHLQFVSIFKLNNSRFIFLDAPRNAKEVLPAAVSKAPDEGNVKMADEAYQKEKGDLQAKLEKPYTSQKMEEARKNAQDSLKQLEAKESNLSPEARAKKLKEIRLIIEESLLSAEYNRYLDENPGLPSEVMLNLDAINQDFFDDLQKTVAEAKGEIVSNLPDYKKKTEAVLVKYYAQNPKESEDLITGERLKIFDRLNAKYPNRPEVATELVPKLNEEQDKALAKLKALRPENVEGRKIVLAQYKDALNVLLEPYFGHIEKNAIEQELGSKKEVPIPKTLERQIAELSGLLKPHSETMDDAVANIWKRFDEIQRGIDKTSKQGQKLPLNYYTDIMKELRGLTSQLTAINETSEKNVNLLATLRYAIGDVLSKKEALGYDQLVMETKITDLLNVSPNLKRDGNGPWDLTENGITFHVAKVNEAKKADDNDNFNVDIIDMSGEAKGRFSRVAMDLYPQEEKVAKVEKPQHEAKNKPGEIASATNPKKAFEFDIAGKSKMLELKPTPTKPYSAEGNSDGKAKGKS